MSRDLLDTNAAADAMFRRRNAPERVKAALAADHDIGTVIPDLGDERYLAYTHEPKTITENHPFICRCLCGRLRAARQRLLMLDRRNGRHMT